MYLVSLYPGSYSPIFTPRLNSPPPFAKFQGAKVRFALRTELVGGRLLPVSVGDPPEGAEGRRRSGREYSARGLRTIELRIATMRSCPKKRNRVPFLRRNLQTRILSMESDWGSTQMVNTVIADNPNGSSCPYPPWRASTISRSIPVAVTPEVYGRVWGMHNTRH